MIVGASTERTVKPVSELSLPERLNFLCTNRIPRKTLTLLMGRLSRWKNPVVFKASLKIWQFCSDDFNLQEACEANYQCLHDVFTRKLKPDARPLDNRDDIVVSPVDAIVGAFGNIDDVMAIQAKGFPYSIVDLVQDQSIANRYKNGKFLTLRLKSSMYHRFHAPFDGEINSVNYISGDTWNVNPIALKVVERLFCKNERVVLEPTDENGNSITMVAVAAVLVASVKVHGLAGALDLRYQGPNRMAIQRNFSKGEELGYFQHGSSFVLLLPASFEFDASIQTSQRLNMGEAIGHFRQETH